MKSLFLSSLLFVVTTLSAQNTYYQKPDGEIIDEAAYKKFTEELSRGNKVGEFITATRNANDSIIKTIRLDVTPLDGAQYADPYALHEKSIGQHFPIEKFKKSNGIEYAEGALKGRPTFINFWFIHCPPCVAELPDLNMLKEKYGKNVNFIAITFDEALKVTEFLKNNPLRFEHITDARRPINEMQVHAYPMSLLLDKEGNIAAVFGTISSGDAGLARQLNSLLAQ
jgi:thiol-disulfide isomerase/thioredoxin